MNSRIHFKNPLRFGKHPALPVILLSLPLATGCLKQLPTSELTVAEAPVEETAISDADETDLTSEETGLSYAAVNVTPSEIVVPANLRPSGPAADMIKLINAGAEDSLMMAFVTNSAGVFNLRAEEIVYLSDLGVPPQVLTAILQHDHLLRAQPVESIESEPLIADAIPDLGTVSDNQTALPGQSPSNEPIFGADSTVPPPPPNYQAVNATFSPTEPAAPVDFYDALAPYGSWVEVDGYGSCWQPAVSRVNHSWAPYFDRGRWVYSDCGWYWMSDYSWGWATFHYGRWFQHAHLGWCWTPDRVWGPSWVCWRSNEELCGWAPLPPGADFHPGTGLRFHGNPVPPDCHFNLAAGVFHFVPAGRLVDLHPQQHAVPRARLVDVFHHSTPSANFTSHHGTVANLGLPAEHFAAAGHKPLVPVSLHAVESAVARNSRERFEGNGRGLTIQKLPEIKVAVARRPASLENPMVQTAATVERPRNDANATPIPLQSAVTLRNHEVAWNRMSREPNQNLQARLSPEIANRAEALLQVSSGTSAHPETLRAQIATGSGGSSVARMRQHRDPPSILTQPETIAGRLVQIRPGVFGSTGNGRLPASQSRLDTSATRWWIPTGGEQVDPLSRPSHHLTHQPGHSTPILEPTHPLNLGRQQPALHAEPTVSVPHVPVPASTPSPSAPPAHDHTPASSESHSSHSTASTPVTDHQTSSDSHSKGH